jgi:hypothetical protein
MLKHSALGDTRLARNVLRARILIPMLCEVPHGHVDNVGSLSRRGLSFALSHLGYPAAKV